MASIERIPRCGQVEVINEPIGNIVSIVLTGIGLIGLLTAIIKYEETAEIAAEIAAKIATYLGGASAAGAAAGFIAAVATLAVIGYFVIERCNSKGGENVCVAGVVQNVVQDFDDFLDDLFPFAAMHDRVELVVKSNYWDIVENNAANVFCTNETPESFRKSEILRCYYFTDQVCDAARGAFIGGSIGAIGGIVAAIFIAAAITCATIILCLFAIIVAALAAAAIVLIGALIGGHIAKGKETTPGDDSGSIITIGDLLTVNGPIFAKGYDSGANVMWWVESSSLSGRASENIPNNPYSYCEIDEEFVNDGCPRPGAVIL